MSSSKKRKNVQGDASEGKVRIFIVEDEIVIVRGLEDALQRLGYDVCGFALSGEEAIEQIVAKRPDLVLVDIYLRGAMDGIELSKAIHDACAVPVIYITAYSNQEILERAKLTGPVGYIVKPFRERQLKVEIELALERIRAEKERKKLLESYCETIRELEKQIHARTEELAKTRADLQFAAEKLTHKRIRLDRLHQEVQEVSRALSALTGHIARTREDLGVEVAVAVRSKVLPILELLRADPAFQQYGVEFDMLSLHMNHLSARLVKESEPACALSTTELRIAVLIKNNLKNEEIAAHLCLSPETVKTHRKNIRKKLGLKHSSKNLSTYLKINWSDPLVPV